MLHLSHLISFHYLYVFSMRIYRHFKGAYTAHTKSFSHSETHFWKEL